jgi:hypothetical protein
LPKAHTPVTGQRNTPETRSAHNNTTFLTGTERNGATQPESGFTEINRDRFCGSRDEASQHNNGAGCEAVQLCNLPRHTLVEATRLTTPDDESTHTITADGPRFASAVPVAANTPTTNNAAILIRLKRFISPTFRD